MRTCGTGRCRTSTRPTSATALCGCGQRLGVIPPGRARRGYPRPSRCPGARPRRGDTGHAERGSVRPAYLAQFLAGLIAVAAVAAGAWLAVWAAAGHWRSAIAAVLILAAVVLLLANPRLLHQTLKPTVGAGNAGVIRDGRGSGPGARQARARQARARQAWRDQGDRCCPGRRCVRFRLYQPPPATGYDAPARPPLSPRGGRPQRDSLCPGRRHSRRLPGSGAARHLGRAGPHRRRGQSLARVRC